jgi:hypothetical protein
MPLSCSTGPEALEWLRDKAAPKGFALNRFPDKAEAARFVEQLYQLGATKVFVPDDAIRDYEKLRREVGGACADSLVVGLPSEPERRKAVLEFCVQELRDEGLDDETPDDSVVDGRYIYLWWD